MNHPQELWWIQARSDYSVFIHLSGQGFPECHRLHYLQMTTEKLSKAYLWRSGYAPSKSHVGFLRFMRALLDRQDDLDRVALIFGFGRPKDLDRWVHRVRPLAFSFQQIAPAEAGSGPNPEYPWPHASPTKSPATHTFALWNQWTTSGQGQKLLAFVDRAVTTFDQYA